MADYIHSNADYDGETFLKMYDQDQQQQFDLGSELEQGNAKHSTSTYDSSSSGKLFVGGVSWETTEETFSDYFSKFGEIADSVIMTDKQTGRPRGFGFVTFCEHAVADMVLKKDHVIDGRSVEVKRTVPKADKNDNFVSRTKKIFVGGIPPALTEDEFKDYFSSFGSIAEHQIMIDFKTNRSRGFGFITFENEDAVENVFAGDKKHELGGKQVEVRKAVPRTFSCDFNSNAAHTSSGNDMYRCVGRAFGAYDVYNSYSGYGGNYAGFYSAYSYGFSYGGSAYMNGRYGGMNGYGVTDGGGYGRTPAVGCAINGNGKGYGKGYGGMNGYGVTDGGGYGCTPAVGYAINGNGKGYGGMNGYGVTDGGGYGRTPAVGCAINGYGKGYGKGYEGNGGLDHEESDD